MYFETCWAPVYLKKGLFFKKFKVVKTESLLNCFIGGGQNCPTWKRLTQNSSTNVIICQKNNSFFCKGSILQKALLPVFNVFSMPPKNKPT